jgi:hypothetical protein
MKNGESLQHFFHNILGTIHEFFHGASNICGRAHATQMALPILIAAK